MTQKLSMSRIGKLGHVKLSGASLTFNNQAPNHDAVEPNGSNTRVCMVVWLNSSKFKGFRV